MKRVQHRTVAEIKILEETDYIVRKAQARDCRIVRIGKLILFSTETGDAWMVDPKDAFALCLARDGNPQEYRVEEMPEKFLIEWNTDYRIEGDALIVCERNGRTRTIMGYPVREIEGGTQ